MAFSNFNLGNYQNIKFNSYEVRNQIAVKGELSSREVFTKTLNKAEFEDWSFLEKQSNWVPERAGLHAKIVQTNLNPSCTLNHARASLHLSSSAMLQRDEIFANPKKIIAK